MDGGLTIPALPFTDGTHEIKVKGTLCFDGTNMLISGAVKAVELGSAAAAENALSAPPQ